MSIRKIQKKLRGHRRELSARFGIKNISIFGSYARGEQKKGSDIDLLVEYSKTPGFFALIDAEDYMSRLLGIKVDLVTKGSLKNPYISRAVKKEVVRV